MAAVDFVEWVAEEKDSEVIQRVTQDSAIEAVAKGVPMNTMTKSVPRSHGHDVAVIARGGTYTDDTNVADDILLTARKFTGKSVVYEEDVDDSFADVVLSRQFEYATSYAKAFDNAAIATTGAANGTTVPFTSIWKAVKSNDTNAGYTADANYTSGSLAGTGGYNNLSVLLGKVENSDYWSDGDMVVIAHPAVRQSLRGITDNNGAPIFVQGLAGTPDTLFGVRIVWSLGAKTSATVTSNPGGNPLVVVANVQYLLRGDRSTLETKFIDAGINTTTDEHTLKFRSRKGFAVANPKAVAVFEKTS